MTYPEKNKGRHATATAIMTGKSKLIALAETAKAVGDTRAAKPNTESRLKILLPTTLPTAISRSPLMAAIMEVATKGERDIAVGNVVGSNIFNLLSVLGLA